MTGKSMSYVALMLHSSGIVPQGIFTLLPDQLRNFRGFGVKNSQDEKICIRNKIVKYPLFNNRDRHRTICHMISGD